MTNTNYREAIMAAFLIMLLCGMLAIRLPVMAEQEAAIPEDDVQSILEKSLSLVEIDKEIARIGESKRLLMETMSETEIQLVDRELQIADKRDQAGNVLRAYYMGERDMLYSSLLSSKSWNHFFRLLDYIDIIVSHDKHTLNGYIGQYRDLQNQYSELEGKQAELIAMENKLQMQRERVVALEKDLSRQLEGRSDSERIMLLMQELTSFWESAGLEEVREYFKALSLAMGELPEWIQDNKDLLSIKGFQYTITVPEDRLNEFLREQDERFRYFSFRFQDGVITAHGQRDNIEISISGNYSVQDKPKNGIIFQVNELLFNGFTLPDTTRAALEDEFDLGFYPGLMVSFLKAKSVEVRDGELIIRLSLSL